MAYAKPLVAGRRSRPPRCPIDVRTHPLGDGARKISPDRPALGDQFHVAVGHVTDVAGDRVIRGEACAVYGTDTLDPARIVYTFAEFM